MKKIKINFADFWAGFSKTDNYFYNLLKEKYDIEISDDPDYLFFSIFGNSNMNYICKKICYLGENLEPPYHGSHLHSVGFNCDYSFSFDANTYDGRNYRLPHYMLYNGYYDLVNKKVDESLLNRKFCNFIVSNAGNPDRNNFFIKLSKYKRVDSGGKFLNNVGGPIKNKIDFQKDYKFSLAFENNEYRPGYEWYITEKIFEPMTVNSIPIYKGATKIGEDFNTKSFVNWHDFKSDNDVIDFIIDLDKNDDKYMNMLQQPWLNNNIIPDNNKLENIKEFLYKLFDN